MRRLLNSLPKVTLAAAALILLLTAGVLLEGSRAAYDSRDAFAAQVERGERTLSISMVAKEWRSEIAAQQFKARRDVILARVLLATGALALVAFAVSFRLTPAPPPVPPRAA